MISPKLKEQAKELISELKDIAEYSGMDLEGLMSECSAKEGMEEEDEMEESMSAEIPESMEGVDENVGMFAPKAKKVAIIAEIKKKRMG
jgi:hypothetical protein